MADIQAQPTRRPYSASCHCGATRFIVFLTLPHALPADRNELQDFYKCNCTTCQKTSIFHLRLDSSPDDFLLLSPLDPYNDMGDYTSRNKIFHALFCRNCAVRCFVFMGEGETVDMDLGELGVAGYQKGATTKVWRPKKEGWKEGVAHGCYLSVNAYTIDAKQEGFDLVDLTEKKLVSYYDYLRVGEEGMGPVQLSRPHRDGAY